MLVLWLDAIPITVSKHTNIVSVASVCVCLFVKMLDGMRRQFTQLLYDMKFLSNPNPKAAESNRNSGMIIFAILQNTSFLTLLLFRYCDGNACVRR